ncbi:MAG: TetR family transcriptional regulator [Thermomicrobiales bacterium]
MSETVSPPPRSARATAIIAAAMAILEAEGRAALTMRRLAEAVGMRAPSLYKHFPDKAAVETALIEQGFIDAEQVFSEAAATTSDPLSGVLGAYRRFATQRPQLYRLMTQGPLPRHLLAAGVEERASAVFGAAVGDPDLARALFAFAHGMMILQLDERFLPDADLDAAWERGLRAFTATRRGGETRAAPTR